jgi:NAD(P) transhydrogenase subunit alpha
LQAVYIPAADGSLQAITPTSVLGALAVFFASINIFGGFAVTERMLDMFRKKKK